MMPILKDFKFHSPESLSEALRLLEKAKRPLLLAGGTFLLNYLKKTVQHPTDVISLKKIAVLRGIRPQGKGLWIGPMTTIDALESGPAAEAFVSLGETARLMGTTPIRHMATVGGNIASRFFWADFPTVLISLGARVTVTTKKKKETLPLEAFLRQPPSKKFILTGLFLPQKNRASIYFRHTKTVQEVDVPSLGLAFSCLRDGQRLGDVRLWVNTTVSLPLSLKTTAEVFENSSPDQIIIGSVHEALAKDAQGTKLDEHRLQLLKNDLQKLAGFLKHGATRAKA